MTQCLSCAGILFGIALSLLVFRIPCSSCNTVRVVRRLLRMLALYFLKFLGSLIFDPMTKSLRGLWSLLVDLGGVYHAASSEVV